MDYPTIQDIYCYDLVSNQRVRIIREDYQGLRVIVNGQEVYRRYDQLRKF